MKYVKLSRVEDYITLDPNEYHDVQEDIVKAMQRMRLAPVFEHASVVLEVENYKAPLPKDMQQIRFVAAMENAPSASEFLDLCSNCTETGSEYDCTSCSEVTAATLAQFPVGLAERQGCRITKQGITYIYDYYAFANSGYFRNNFSLMYPRRNPFTNGFLCADCEPIMSTCSDTYEILPTGEIMTSFDCGTICIDYFKYSTDSDGDLLIPDNTTLHEALAAYVMWKHWETRWNKNNQNAERKMIWYQKRWVALKRQFRGEIVIAEYDPIAINQIIYKDVKEARSIKNFNYARSYISSPW